MEQALEFVRVTTPSGNLTYLNKESVESVEVTFVSVAGEKAQLSVIIHTKTANRYFLSTDLAELALTNLGLPIPKAE